MPDSEKRPNILRTAQSFSMKAVDEELFSTENDTTLTFEAILDPSFTQTLRDFQIHLHCLGGSPDLRCEAGFRAAWNPQELSQAQNVVLLSFMGTDSVVPLYAISPVHDDRQEVGRYLQIFLRLKKKTDSTAPQVSGRFSLEVRGTFFGA